MEVLSRAEEIQAATEWSPKLIPLEAPVSGRALSKREEIILLEGSKLHGFIFPPWKSDPEDSVFEEWVNGSEFYLLVDSC